MPKLTYCYADISGRGIAPRHLLAHAKADYLDISYDYKISHKTENYDPVANNHLLAKWPADKQNLQKSNPFVLLPYVKTEEDKIISSTIGVMSYLGKRFGYLTGEDDFEVYNAFDQAHELREGFLKSVASPMMHGIYSDPEGYVGPWRNLATFELKLTQNGGQNGESKKYLFSDTKLSIADFYLFSTISMMFKWHKNILGNYPKLAEWYAILLAEDGLAQQVEKEKDQPILGNQDGYTEMGAKFKIPGMDNMFWGTPGKMEAKFE